MQYGYDKVSQQWQNLPVVQRGALSLVRNFDAVIVYELSESAPGSADPF